MANFHIFTEGEREGMGRVLFLVDCFKFYIKSMDTNTPRPSGGPRPRVIKIKKTKGLEFLKLSLTIN